MPLAATKLTQSPWFLNPGKFFQPPFLHWSLLVGMGWALAKHEPDRLREQTMLARDGAIGFVNFATRAWEAYAEKHGLEMGPPEPEHQEEER